MAAAAATAGPTRRGAAAERALLRRLGELVTSSLGIRMPEHKLSMLAGRLQRRLRDLELASIADYETILLDPERGPDEMVAFMDIITTNKTDFFREPDHFAYLTTVALPTLAAGRDRWALKLWCAGCSTGQEVYTLAMVLEDYAEHHPGFTWEIFATDISTRVLREAVRATYRTDLVDPVPPLLRTRYLMRGTGPRKGFVRVVPELRRKVTFGRLNFMDENYPVPTGFDIIFFRNVLIYFDPPIQEAVVQRQCRHLTPGGYMFIAHTESLNGLDVPLDLERNSILRRR
jgi:chemotaxis protein methyltransferase CheR